MAERLARLYEGVIESDVAPSREVAPS